MCLWFLPLFLHGHRLSRVSVVGKVTCKHWCRKILIDRLHTPGGGNLSLRFWFLWQRNFWIVALLESSGNWQLLFGHCTGMFSSRIVVVNYIKLLRNRKAVDSLG